MVLTMQHKQFEKLTWMLIYGGMLGISLGWFIQAGNAALGVGLMIAGGLVATLGVAMIFMRARMGP